MAQSVELENADIWGAQLRYSQRRQNSIRSWSNASREPDDVFTRSAHSRSDRNELRDEEALKWAALEKLPTYDRLRAAILTDTEEGKIITRKVDVRELNIVQRKLLIDKLLKVTEDDNEKFLSRLRNRIDKYIYLPLYIHACMHAWDH